MGRLANLTALLTARNVAVGDAWDHGLAGDGRQPVLLAHAEAHYSVARAAGILGLGSRQTVRVGLDERGRMDPQQLDAELTRLRAEHRPVVAVVACACATPIGAFDPLEEIAAVCRHHGVWLHVDAAHGGAALLSDRHRHLLAGIEQADSVVWDAHKMLFVPSLCAFVLYRDKRHIFDAFQQDAPYLFDPAAPGLADYDSGVRSVECTKRAAAFGLWGVWSLFGRQLFADMVDVTFALGRAFHEKLAAAEDFLPLHEPQCNIVVFRHLPAELRNAPPERVGDFQLELRRRVIESGEFYIVPAKHDGVGALRVAIMNPLTTAEHLDQLMDALRRHGRELLSGREPRPLWTARPQASRRDEGACDAAPPTSQHRLDLAGPPASCRRTARADRRGAAARTSPCRGRSGSSCRAPPRPAAPGAKYTVVEPSAFGSAAGDG